MTPNTILEFLAKNRKLSYSERTNFYTNSLQQGLSNINNLLETLYTDELSKLVNFPKNIHCSEFSFHLSDIEHPYLSTDFIECSSSLPVFEFKFSSDETPPLNLVFWGNVTLNLLSVNENEIQAFDYFEDYSNFFFRFEESNEELDNAEAFKKATINIIFDEDNESPTGKILELVSGREYAIYDTFLKAFSNNINLFMASFSLNSDQLLKNSNSYYFKKLDELYSLENIFGLGTNEPLVYKENQFMLLKQDFLLENIKS